MNPEKLSLTDPVDWASIPLNPDAGPQIWYTDGNLVQRLDDDNMDNVLEPSIRDLALMRAVLTLATYRVTQWEQQHWAQQARDLPRPQAPIPARYDPFV